MLKMAKALRTAHNISRYVKPSLPGISAPFRKSPLYMLKNKTYLISFAELHSLFLTM